ncbi:MAG: DUF4142 domain-containing protein [Gemmatimonas sp.]
MTPTLITHPTSVRQWQSLVRTLARAAFLAQTIALPVIHAQGATMAPAPMSGHASADASQRLVNFVTSVNRDEIEMGKLALSKAASADVRAYAQHMIDDHTNAQAAWAERVPTWSLTIPDSAKTAAVPAKAQAGAAAMSNGISEVRDTTTALRGGSTAAAIHSANLAALGQLKGLSGAAFDRAYMTAQQTGHKAVLRELTAQPNNNSDMQTLMTIFRATVEKHQSEALKIQP